VGRRKEALRYIEIMCGRYYRQADKQKIAESFHVTRWAPDVHLAPDYNIAPSTFQPIIRSSPEDGKREVVLMRWGLIPAKAADPDAFKTFSTCLAVQPSKNTTRTGVLASSARA
jgi:putative SOS response-associated peptidase YedK